MAVLSDPDRVTAWRQWMADSAETVSANKSEVRQLIDAADAWADANAVAYNTAIPAGIRNKFSVAQKALALAFVCMRRAGK